MTRFPDGGAVGWLPQTLTPLLFLGALQGCALFFQAPAVRIVGVEVVSLGLSSGTAEVALEVTNQGRSEMRIRGFLYQVQVKSPEDDGDWNDLAEGFHDQALAIPGRESREIRVPVPFQYSALKGAFRRLLSIGDLPYRLTGEVWMGGANLGLQIPFRSEGAFRP